MDCSPPGSSVHGISQARIPEWVAVSLSRDLPDPGIKLTSPALRRLLYRWATREAPGLLPWYLSQIRYSLKTVKWARGWYTETTFQVTFRMYSFNHDPAPEVKLSGVVGSVMPPEDTCFWIPRAWEYIRWQRGTRFIDDIKIANHLTLHVEDYPGLSQWTQGHCQFSSFTQLCPTLCDPMDCSAPGFPVHHQLPELAQTHVHRVGDAIQPSHPLSSPSPLTFHLSQNQGLFQWVSSSHQVAKVLEFQLQHQSFQWIFRTDFLENELVGSPCSPRDSQEFSPTPQFKSISSSALSFLYGPTLTSIHDY